MRVLLFKNNCHSTDPVEIPNHEMRAVNLTVRKGLKWADLQVGETVELRDAAAKDPLPKTQDRKYATIFDIKVMAFNDLANYNRMLQLEHDPACQTFSGLHSVMRTVYDGFLHHELVTLVFYEVVI